MRITKFIFAIWDNANSEFKAWVANEIRGEGCLHLKVGKIELEISKLSTDSIVVQSKQDVRFKFDVNSNTLTVDKE